MHFHSQNLNETRIAGGKRIGSMWRHGRCWLHLNDECGWKGKVIRAEWHFGDFRCALTLDLNGVEHEVVLHFAVPLISIFLGLNPHWAWLWKKVDDKHRCFGVRIHGWALWWSFWEDEMCSSRDDPWWMRGCWHIDNFFLGKTNYEKVEHPGKLRIFIPLPEGEYLAEATYDTSTWRRRHWPWWPLTRIRHWTSVDVLQWGGLLHEGKGENSWDCGTDGTMGYSSEGHDLPKAIAHGVEICLRDRNRYGGSGRGHYPSPIITKNEGMKAFARVVARHYRNETKYPKYTKTHVWTEQLDEKLSFIHHAQVDGKYQASITVPTKMVERWDKILEEAIAAVNAEPDDDARQVVAP